MTCKSHKPLFANEHSVHKTAYSVGIKLFKEILQRLGIIQLSFWWYGYASLLKAQAA